ncbi:MAG: succinate dehydrogenase assembly factor 2 [Comamonadaceae bacterium]|jgi:antitoxin CptB|uniref:FAD assembly factor SdhE n=2 Tax=Betaproteobacteria TaxID=28216 RepID=UPI001E1A006C|nr:succinate dehydrogenase assembly factor 2 [Comamonadaceae bacterium]MBK7988985.1 succinate dehydrogenase assembly factor 2 [Comamonadaceae bacterium]MBK8357735.1 succinate dehydrogenase assembly factor 2 [Comamonadaceae bacterium]MBK9200349.1 succinate dehydrogenase assembly factor 2 [Betaproteobacteria bacterium]
MSDAFLPQGAPGELLDERDLSKLRWRCRRGLLENDLLIEKFFERYAGSLTVGQARGLHALMELADNDLLDLLLWRKEPGVDITTMEMSEVLGMLRGGRVGAREQLAG